MSKNIFIIILIFFVVINSKEQIDLEENEYSLKIEESNNEINLNEESMKLHKMKELINIYIESRHWNSNTILDKDTFTRMFIYVVNKSIFKKNNRDDLEILAERIFEKYGKPILIKNIKELFIIDELKTEFNKILNGKNNKDL